MRKEDKFTMLFGLAGLALLIWLLYKNKLTEVVSHTIDFNGTLVGSTNALTLQGVMNKMYSNEYLKNGKLCTMTNGHEICFAGDPLEILSKR